MSSIYEGYSLTIKATVNGYVISYKDKSTYQIKEVCYTVWANAAQFASDYFDDDKLEGGKL